MENEKNQEFLSHVLRNTERKVIDKAAKNFNVNFIFEKKKRIYITEFFGGDALKYSRAVSEISANYIDHEDAAEAQALTLEYVLLEKALPHTIDKVEKKELENRLAWLSRTIQPYTTKMKKLVSDHSKSKKLNLNNQANAASN